ncbi:MAG: hypothetical protein DRG20_03015 [Deltaproteobacteria bacterium]|nr:MAG: hypothetical protein DRG20_03015 [Deltaproteobacteria bacterium]
MRKIVGVSIILVCLMCIYVFAQNWQSITDPVKVFSKGYIQVIGTSEEGQTRYRAIRAATVVAQRDLLEILQGLNIYGTTTIRDGMLQSDTIRTTVQGFLKGAIKCGEKYYPERGYAEVCLRLYIKGKGGLYDIILPLMKDEGLLPPPASVYKPKLIPEIMEKPQTNETTQMQKFSTQEITKPSELIHPYDGVIIDVRDYIFRPALINRILTDKGEVIFDPSKIVSSVLVERGCGGFTNNLDKAKALLKTWGSNNPMFIKAVGVVKFTDVKVSEDDAATIFIHNQKTQFLNQAKVVFLLK